MMLNSNIVRDSSLNSQPLKPLDWVQVDSFDREPRGGTIYTAREHSYVHTRFAEVLIGSFSLTLRHDGSIYLIVASHCDHFEDLINAFERLQPSGPWSIQLRTDTIQATSRLPNLDSIHALLRTAELADSSILAISNDIRCAIDSAQLRYDQYIAEYNSQLGRYKEDLRNQPQTTSAIYRPSQCTESHEQPEIQADSKRWCNIL